MKNAHVKSAYLQIALRPLLAMAVDIAERAGGPGLVKKQLAREWLNRIYQANGFARDMQAYEPCQDAWLAEVVQTKDKTRTWFQDLNAVNVASIVGALKLADT